MQEKRKYIASWIQADRNLKFGTITLKSSQGIQKSVSNTTIFVTDKIRIKLKEGFDAKFLQKAIEVLVHD